MLRRFPELGQGVAGRPEKPARVDSEKSDAPPPPPPPPPPDSALGEEEKDDLRPVRKGLPAAEKGELAGGATRVLLKSGLLLMGELA